MRQRAIKTPLYSVHVGKRAKKTSSILSSSAFEQVHHLQKKRQKKILSIGNSTQKGDKIFPPLLFLDTGCLLTENKKRRLVKRSLNWTIL